MTDNAAIARANAVHCEAKKHGYRQTQDGVVVSFVLHPQEVPDALATAALGTRYILALVEVGDDEKPIVKPEEAQQPRSSDPVPPIPQKASGAKLSWHEMMPTQQAGILCADEEFWKFLKVGTEGGARTYVHAYCDVRSRSQILTGTRAAELWRGLVFSYRAWGRELEVIG